jgi:hypothetical protein
MNLKARHEFEQRHLEAEFRQSKNSEPRLWHGKTDVDFSLPNFFLKMILSLYQKVMTILLNHL